MAFFSKFFKAKKEESIENKATPPAAQPTPDLANTPLDLLVEAMLDTQNAEASMQALARLSSEFDFLTIASQHGVAAVRMAAAENVTQLTQLQVLLENIKGKDKAVYRLAKERIAEHRQIAAAQQARQERIQYLLDQCKYLTRIGYHPEFNGKLSLIKQEWEQLISESSSEQQEQLNSELQAADKILQEFAAEEAAAAAQQQAIESAKNSQQQLLKESAELLEQAHTHSIESLKSAIQPLLQQWDESLAAYKPKVDIGQAFEKTIQQLLGIQTTLQHHAQLDASFHEWLNSDDTELPFNQIQQWKKLLIWPDEIASPAWYQQFAQKVSHIKDNQTQQKKQHDQQLKELESLLSSLTGAIKNGQVKEANRFNQQIIQGFKQLPNQATQALRRQQQALYAQLQEMRDWAEFAIIPKKEALLAEMQSLIGSPIANNLLADKIHQLQEEWKALSNTGLRDHELWQQFNEAAQKAFEPCKAFFAEQTEIRQKFTEQRQALIAELNHYEQALDWSNADWPAVQKTLHTARNTFRTLGPIDRTAHKKTQDQFNNAYNRIHQHLKAQYEHNLALKNTLVNQAQELAASEELKGIVEKVKSLQQQWKEVGITPRSADQALWKSFREHCDIVFKRLDEQREERKAEIDETVQQAHTLVEQALASADLQQIKAANQQLQQLELPKGVQQKLQASLNNAQQQHEQAIQQQEFVGLIARVEHLHGDDSAWNSACELPLPKGINADLFQQARSGQLSSNDTAQDLCVLMEIVADCPSPDSDQARRMELQVQRLSEGLGKGLTQTEEVHQIIERWLCVKADSPLTQRLINAIRHI